MDSNDNTLGALREALRLSPDNIPLRRYLADTLRREVKLVLPLLTWVVFIAEI
jgi:hypothetical protein